MSETAQQYALVAFGNRIEIREPEYQLLRDATTRLLRVLILEEKLDVLLSNHLELESDILNISLRDALLSEALDDKFHANRILLNRRLVNLLGSCTAYRDCALSSIGSLLPEQPTAIELLKSALRSHYDGNLAYRVMDAMRNFVLHHGFPVHKVSYSLAVHETEPRNRISNNISFFASALQLREGKFKTKILNELEAIDDAVDLKPLVRDYVQCLLTTHGELRTKLDGEIARWEACVREAIKRFSSEFPEVVGVELLSCITYLGSELQGEFRVNLSTMDRRHTLSQRNRGFANYGKRFVTNAVD
jgi:hypothetical protein